MIHELIDPKKKTNRGSASKNSKTFQEPKTTSEDNNFEASDSENKESSSNIFIPPWLRNSLGLNQRNNLSHATGSTDLKATKIAQRSKEPSQNEFESLKPNTADQECCKKDRFEILPPNQPKEPSGARGPDDVETLDNNGKRTIPIYWDVKLKDSETEWSCNNAEPKPLKKEDSKMTGTDILAAVDVEKFKEEEKKRLKFMKQKNKLRKQKITCESKQSDLDKNDMDFLLEMKAREALDNYMKGDVRSVSSEMRHLEAKLLLLTAKSRDLSASNQQDLRVLRVNESKNPIGSVEQLERVFEHVKDVNVRGVIRNSEFLSKIDSKKKDDKEEKCMDEILQKCNDDKSKLDRESLLSTDDEKDIKRFSEFLSKNKNVEEKRKCLEEVRNYFERKRRTRLSKRRLDDGKAKLNLQFDGKEEHLKEKLKTRDMYRGKKSKFALCGEEVVKKAVDEALQKFVELYHFRVTPSVLGNMKKNILQAITSDCLENPKLKQSSSAIFGSKKMNLEELGMPEKDLEKCEERILMDTELDVTDSGPQKDIKKKNGKSLNDSEQTLKLVAEVETPEDDKLKRLKKEFDIFLNSVQTHIDVSNLKLQSIILEKEEQTSSAQNVQFVYNFTKKVLETERADYWQSLKEVLDSKHNDTNEKETQTVDMEPTKRNMKIQAMEQKFCCEQGLQTDDKVCTSQDTQTDQEQVTVQEIKELISCDVNPGLYRMVKSKEAGKFYLYPEHMEDSKEEVSKSNSSLLKEKKYPKKRNLVTTLSKERAKDRQVLFRSREKTKLKKSKKAPVYAVAQTKTPSRRRKKEAARDDSISCLYFRNFEKQASDSISSKKEVDLTDENPAAGAEPEDALPGHSKDDHLGCFWFWDGEKISPGCDLKTHVENLLKEKLTQITYFGTHQNEGAAHGFDMPKTGSDLLMNKVSEKNLDVRNANAIFCFGSIRNAGKENTFPENENSERRKRNFAAERKKEENGEMDYASASAQKSVKNVGTQDTHLRVLPSSHSKHKTHSGSSSTIRRRFTRRNIVIKPTQRKLMNLKKAEDFLRAVEEMKIMKLGLANSKKEQSTDSESLELDCSTSTSFSKNRAEDPLSAVLGLKEDPEMETISDIEIKTRLKKSVSPVDREVQTIDMYEEDQEVEEENSGENHSVNPVLDNQKHIDLIGRVLSGVSQRQREHLWNDVRNFLKTKIGKDIDDEDTREVCIEIEQDMPELDQGKTKRSIMAKGHYSKNEGDVEVEIDLTLEDLARILRQRQRKSRKRNIYRKILFSSSSAQSDIIRDDIRRYQKYLKSFATLGEGLSEEKDSKAYKKNKGN